MAGKSKPVKHTKTKYSLVLIIGVAVLYVLSLIGAYYVGSVSQNTQTGPLANILERKSCTLDARLCPDGRTVGRVGPNCDFAPCSTTPIRPISTYKCPTSEWIDCMPAPGGTDKPQCQPEYLQWAQESCPGFKGAAY